MAPGNDSSRRGLLCVLKITISEARNDKFLGHSYPQRVRRFKTNLFKALDRAAGVITRLAVFALLVWGAALRCRED